MNDFFYYTFVEAKNILVLHDQIGIPSYGINPSGLVDEISTDELFGSYLKGCIRTWNTSNPPLLQIPNAALGLIGEICEYTDSGTLDEFGDLIYYRAIFRYLLGDVTEIYSTKTVWEFNLTETINLIADVAKKFVYHTKMHDVKTLGRYHQAFDMLDALLLHNLKHIHKLDSFQPVFEYNLSKLAKRHQVGFNPNYDSSTEVK